MKRPNVKDLIPALRRHKTPALWAAFLVSGMMAVWLASPAEAESAVSEPPAELSTFIPKGYTLIPIELKGAERLEGVLGSHGIVDLYESSDQPGSRPRLVGRRLRLLRAPLNPQAFAVLVRDTEAERILSFTGPFAASVLSQQSETHQLPETARRGPTIEFQKESAP